LVCGKIFLFFFATDYTDYCGFSYSKEIIYLPESPETLHKLLEILRQYGLISDKKARSIEQNEQTSKQEGKSRWARAAERLKSEGFLKGQGEEVKKLTRDFRENFSL
jgi:hypothetical protein